MNLLPLASIILSYHSTGGPAFDTQIVNGVASFRSPSGQQLWSFGVDCVDTGTSRKDYKVSNPSYGSFKQFENDREWTHDTIDKLKRWGFNSTGGWSDDDLFKKYGGTSRLPYFVVLHLGAWDQAPWHDMFDKQMDHWVTVAAEKQIPQLAGDPALVGYFTDNELGWWDDTLFLAYMRMKPESPGRKRFIRSLRETYHDDFERLKKEWLVKGGSFESIQDLRLRPGSPGRRAVDAWAEVLGRRYYSLVRDTVRRFDKRHLILGDRYCQYYTLPIVRAAKDYVDVVSTNFGADWNDGTIAPFFLRTLHTLTGKPVIVTEFYMCANENRSGNKNSSAAFPVVQSQTERAKAFSTYVTAIASLPYSVGAHWFQFSDEPSNGRGDGENFNMGLVDIEGRPYEELVSASAALDFKALRAKAKDPQPAGTIRVPMAEWVPTTTLKGWPRDRGALPVSSGTPFGDMFATQDKGALYLGLYAMDYMDESLYEGGRISEVDRNRWQIRIDGLSRPIDIRYGGKGKKASINQGGIEVNEKPGLKYTVVVKIPKLLLNHRKALRLTAVAETHSRSSSMAWKASLLLNQ